MKNIKNLNVNTKRRLSALILAGTIAATAIGLSSCTKHETLDGKTSISIYYGNDSDMYKLAEYLDVSVNLEKLNLNRYSSKQIEEIGLHLEEKLANPSYIEEKIEEFKTTKEPNMEDLDAEYRYLELVAFLKQQDRLVYEHIKSSYKTIYSDYTKSLKEYAAEEYNLDNPLAITFSYYLDDGVPYYGINYGESFMTHNSSINSKYIKNGIDEMVKLQNLEENNPSRSEIRDEYINALVLTIKNRTNVADNDLYNQKSEDALKR